MIYLHRKIELIKIFISLYIYELESDKLLKNIK